MNMRDKSKVDFPVGVGVDAIAPMPTDRTGHPGIGLDNIRHVYGIPCVVAVNRFPSDTDLEVAKVYSSPYATHVRYTVKR